MISRESTPIKSIGDTSSVDSMTGSVPNNNIKSLWSLAPIGLILFIMLFSVTIYYIFTAILPGLFRT